MVKLSISIRNYTQNIFSRKDDMLSHFVSFAKWLVLSFLVGAAAGGAGTLFYFCVSAVTSLRLQYTWLVFLLPLGGAAIVFLYFICRVEKPQGTDLIIESIRSPKPVPLIMAPLIFVSTVLTHLFGGSAGREGAALQLGGSLGYHIGRLFRLDEKDLHIITMCGMAACFAALFGTPATSTIFVLEVVTVGVMYYAALVPCAVAALTGASVARYFHAVPTFFPIASVPAFGIGPAARVAALAILCAALSIAFCSVMRGTGKLLKKWIPNTYLRAAAGGAAVLALSFVFGRDYLGMGGDVIAASLNGTAHPEAFALKLLFTAITLGAGFRGGEIVPAFFVGATFGCFAGGLLGLSPAFAASVGFMAVFCGVTNCPITALILSLEVFGGKGFDYYLLAAGISYALSGYSGIYHKQQILYAKNKLLFLGKAI